MTENRIKEILEAVPARNLGTDQTYQGDPVDHEEQLYISLHVSFYLRINEAAETLGYPLKYTRSRGMHVSCYRPASCCLAILWAWVGSQLL